MRFSKIRTGNRPFLAPVVGLPGLTMGHSGRNSPERLYLAQP
jgi:hypothetical protein